MRDFIVGSFHLFSKRKILLLGLFALITSIFIFFSSQIEVEEDIMSIMPQTEENSRVNFVLQNLSSSDKIILQLSFADTNKTPDPDLFIHYADLIADSLTQLTGENLIKEVFYQTDLSSVLEAMNFLYANLPYFLKADDYERIDTLLNSNTIRKILTENRKKLTSPAGMIYRDALLHDPLHLSSSILQELQGLQVETNYKTIDGYIFSSNEKSLLMFITPYHPSSETAQNKIMVKRLVEIIDSVSSSSENNIRISYFGAAAVAVANATRIKEDSLISILIALILIALILASYFRSVRMIILLMLPIAFGGLFSLGTIFLIKGSISAIALGTGSIVLGIAIDYSLHFFIHLRQEPSIEKTIRDISFPLVVGSCTTITAFLSLIFLKSQLLEDFGLFAALTLMGTILFTLIFLPHFLSQKRLNQQRPTDTTIWNKIAGYSLENNNLVIFAILILTIIFSFYADEVKFEDNMNKINYMTNEQKESFEELSHTTTLSRKMIYFVNEGVTIDDALEAYEQFQPLLDTLQREGLTTSQSGIGYFLPSSAKQKEKIEQWNEFWEGKREIAKQLLKEEGVNIGFNSNAFQHFFSVLDRNFAVENTSYFDPVKESLLENFLIENDNKAVVVTMLYSDPVDAKTVEDALPQNDKSFHFDTTTLTKSMLKELSSEFNYILWICGIIILVFLFFSFGRIEITLISFLPMVVAFIWILGIMALFDIRFNIVNIILATFIFGIGDDYSIFIMEGLLHEYTYGKKMLKTYKTAVILSAVTMLIGIGSLIFAKHPAMFSLAQVTIIGMLSVALISYTVSPYIFKLMTTKKGEKRLIPVTLWNLIKSIISFLVFLVGSILLTLIGFFWVTLCGNNARHKYHFHLCLWAIMRTLSKMMIQVPFKILNPYHETFEKPGIIISNHQSHLDLLYILALSPKIIVLTNKWVWNSPFYGWILRYADFVPVADGIEDHIPRLEALTKQGYSILIFPEGTRSETSSILRFHKGAFYLAKKLKLDIIPVLVHGVGHILPKTEFMLRRGSITVKILHRVSVGDARLRNFSELSQEAKAFREFYKIEYGKLSTERETTAYFRDFVLHNYIYKGVGIEREVKRLLRKNSDFEKLMAKLPDKGSVLIQNCGIGVFTLMAALVKKGLQITATDNKSMQIDIAKQCSTRSPNLKYEYSISDDHTFDQIFIMEVGNDAVISLKS